jgi:16S rRNA G966 N2-methylase RsmD
VASWLAGRGASVEPFDLVVVDPPYADVDALGRTLAALGSVDAPVVAGGRVVAKHFWRDRPADRIGMLTAERDRRFGETALTFYRREEAPTE